MSITNDSHSDNASGTCTLDSVFDWGRCSGVLCRGVETTILSTRARFLLPAVRDFLRCTGNLIYFDSSHSTNECWIDIQFPYRRSLCRRESTYIFNGPYFSHTNLNHVFNFPPRVFMACDVKGLVRMGSVV